MKTIPEGIFKPKPNAAETRNDAMSRLVRDIHDAETAAREAKTLRLRLARLEMERLAPAPATPVKAKRKPAK
ncbi:MAG: hypothetical protein IPL47_15855 [Phyllobacteriaceae bacterium]|nr:hypothetical protein [Phyllobacteriaceae bacterium]